MSAVNTHLDNYTINLILAALPPTAAGFGGNLWMVPLADNSLAGSSPQGVGENDSVYATLTSAAEAVAANADTAGSYSAATINALTAFFNQEPQPTQVVIVAVDLVGTDTYGGILAAMEVQQGDFVWIQTPHLRTAATQAAIATAASGLARKRVYVAQGSVADYKGSAGDFAGTDLGGLADGKAGTFLIWHNADAEFDDVRYAGSISTADPDVVSAPGDLPITGGGALAPLTQGEKNNLRTNNVNFALPLPGAPRFMDPGVMLDGRPLYERVTAMWFETRLVERLAGFKVAKSTNREKVFITPAGQAEVIGTVLKPLVDEGISAGHFLSADEGGTVVIVGRPITVDDVNAQRLRFQIQLSFAASARVFVLDVNIAREAI